MSPHLQHQHPLPPTTARTRASGLTTSLVALCASCSVAAPVAAASTPSTDRPSPGAGRLQAPGATDRASPKVIRVVDRRVRRATRTVTGELMGVSDGPHRYVVQTPSGRQVPVRFTRTIPGRAVGARARVRVDRTGRVRTASFRPRLRTVAATAARPQRAYVALVSNRGSFGSSDATITATVDAALTRWQEESNGAITTFTRAETKPLALTSDCKSGSVSFNEAARKTFPDVDTGSTSGDHIIVISPPGCGGGVGTVQAGIHSGGRLNAAWDPDSTLHTLMHELGHNFSLSHANGCFEPLGPACQIAEYANTYALMGFTIGNDPAYTPAALDSFERTRLGITDAGEVAQATLPAGQRTITTSYDLRARGTDTGQRGVRVTDPTTGTVYSVDWRSGGGRDAGSDYALSPGRNTPGVTVERLAADGRSAAVLAHANPQPGRAPQYGLGAGRTFTEGGTTIAVQSIGDRTDLAATSRIAVTLTDPSVAPGTSITDGPAEGATTTPGTTGFAFSGGAAGANGTPVSPAAPGSTVLSPAKLEVARVAVSNVRRRLQLVAPITARASGRVRVTFRAAGRTTTFAAPVDARRRRVVVDRRIPAAQARVGTGILTLAYPGDADTQPQTVRLRAASRPAGLRAGRPSYADGRLRATGRIGARARGVVRVQLLFEPPTGATRTLSSTATIRGGRYRLDRALPADVRAAIDGRRGVLHSFTLFTGDVGRSVRGELASYEVLGRR